MIKKEDFIKQFPLTVQKCVVDGEYNDTCSIDDDKAYNCKCTTNIKSKEECGYWQNFPSWEYVEDIWNWIDKYQRLQEAAYKVKKEP